MDKHALDNWLTREPLEDDDIDHDLDQDENSRRLEDMARAYGKPFDANFYPVDDTPDEWERMIGVNDIEAALAAIQELADARQTASAAYRHRGDTKFADRLYWERVAYRDAIAIIRGRLNLPKPDAK